MAVETGHIYISGTVADIVAISTTNPGKNVGE